MRFFLVIATLGRSVEVERLCCTLTAQTYKNFGLIIVDQNDDDRVQRIVEAYASRLDITRVTSPKGLSRARNVGLTHLDGDIVAFPDDDCWYPPDLLARVSERFAREPDLAGLTGRSINESGRPSQGRWSPVPMVLSPSNVWIGATSYTIFLRAEAVKEIGGFDESLGVGSGTRWGAGEEVNYLLHGLNKGLAMAYEPTIEVHHPEPIVEYNEKAFARGRLYNRGFGRVLALNALPLHFVAYSLARPALGALLACLKFDLPKARYYAVAAMERFRGWRDGPARSAAQR